MSDWLAQVRWNEQGLVPVVAQDDESGELLMLAWMNREALAETVATGQAVYWSRSRSRLWRKGESSGHTQHVRAILLDCDADSIVLKVEQIGGIACHTGRRSCFYQQLTDGRWQDSAPVLRDPESIYGGGSGDE